MYLYVETKHLKSTITRKETNNGGQEPGKSMYYRETTGALCTFGTLVSRLDLDLGCSLVPMAPAPPGTRTAYRTRTQYPRADACASERDQSTPMRLSHAKRLSCHVNLPADVTYKSMEHAYARVCLPACRREYAGEWSVFTKWVTVH